MGAIGHWENGGGDQNVTVQIEALRNRNRAAWHAVYEALADAVYQHALYRLNGDRAAAEEVTQEVFLRAIETIDTFRGDSDRLLPWLRGIARRVISRRARELRPLAARTLPLESTADKNSAYPQAEAVDPNPRADEQLARADERYLVGSALTALPPHWEQALRWRYCDGKSVAEIARRMGISYKAAESLLSRARAAFRGAYLRLSETKGRSSH